MTSAKNPSQSSMHLANENNSNGNNNNDNRSNNNNSSNNSNKCATNNNNSNGNNNNSSASKSKIDIALLDRRMYATERVLYPPPRNKRRQSTGGHNHNNQNTSNNNNNTSVLNTNINNDLRQQQNAETKNGGSVKASSTQAVSDRAQEKHRAFQLDPIWCNIDVNRKFGRPSISSVNGGGGGGGGGVVYRSDDTGCNGDNGNKRGVRASSLATNGTDRAPDNKNTNDRINHRALSSSSNRNVCSKILACREGYASDYGNSSSTRLPRSRTRYHHHHNHNSGYKSDVNVKSGYNNAQHHRRSRAKSCDYRCDCKEENHNGKCNCISALKVRRKRRSSLMPKTLGSFADEQDILQLAGLSLGQSSEESNEFSCKPSLEKLPKISASKKYGEINRFVTTGQYFNRGNAVAGGGKDLSDTFRTTTTTTSTTVTATLSMSTTTTTLSATTTTTLQMENILRKRNDFLKLDYRNGLQLQLNDFQAANYTGRKLKTRRSSVASCCSSYYSGTTKTKRKCSRRASRSNHLMSSNRNTIVDSKLLTEIEILTHKFAHLSLYCRMQASCIDNLPNNDIYSAVFNHCTTNLISSSSLSATATVTAATTTKERRLLELSHGSKVQHNSNLTIMNANNNNMNVSSNNSTNHHHYHGNHNHSNNNNNSSNTVLMKRDNLREKRVVKKRKLNDSIDYSSLSNGCGVNNLISIGSNGNVKRRHKKNNSSSPDDHKLPLKKRHYLLTPGDKGANDASAAAAAKLYNNGVHSLNNLKQNSNIEPMNNRRRTRLDASSSMKNTLSNTNQNDGMNVVIAKHCKQSKEDSIQLDSENSSCPPPPGVFEPSVQLEIQIPPLTKINDQMTIGIITKSEIQSPLTNDSTRNFLSSISDGMKILKGTNAATSPASSLTVTAEITEPGVITVSATTTNTKARNNSTSKRKRKKINRTGFPTVRRKKRKVAATNNEQLKATDSVEQKMTNETNCDRVPQIGETSDTFLERNNNTPRLSVVALERLQEATVNSNHNIKNINSNNNGASNSSNNENSGKLHEHSVQIKDNETSDINSTLNNTTALDNLKFMNNTNGDLEENKNLLQITDTKGIININNDLNTTTTAEIAAVVPTTVNNEEKMHLSDCIIPQISGSKKEFTDTTTDAKTSNNTNEKYDDIALQQQKSQNNSSDNNNQSNRLKSRNKISHNSNATKITPPESLNTINTSEDDILVALDCNINYIEHDPLPMEECLFDEDVINKKFYMNDDNSSNSGKKSRRAKKKYLVAGLFSDYYKTDRVQTKKNSSSSSIASNNNNNNNNEEENSKSENDTTFQSLLPPPPYCERYFRRTQIDFKLPYDIWWAYKNSKLPSRNTTVQSWNYRKIRTNVYADTLKPPQLAAKDQPICNCKPEMECNDNCLNRMVYTECSPANCPSKEKCRNQKIQRHEVFAGIERFMTKDKGWGIRSKTAIPRGTYIIEYVGEVVTEREFKERMGTIYVNDIHHYCLHLDGGLVIDGHRMGSYCRFVNHSCQPNCEMQKWSVNGLYRMALFAKCDIERSEELTYDYNFSLFNPTEGQECRCDTPQCRGVIGGKSQRIKPLLSENKNGNETISKENGKNRQRKRMARKNLNSPRNKDLTPTVQKVQQLTDKERRFIRQLSILLLRNLRKVQTKKRSPTTATQNNNKKQTKLLAQNESQTLRMSTMVSPLPASATTIETGNRSTSLNAKLPVSNDKKIGPQSSKIGEKTNPKTSINKKNEKIFNTKSNDENSPQKISTKGNNKQTKEVAKKVSATNKKSPINKASDEDIIRCICGMYKDEGLMIQCAQCLVWQHTECTKADINIEKYLCENCEPRDVDREIPLDEFTDEGHRYYLTLMRGSQLQVRQGDAMYVLRDIPIKDSSGNIVPSQKHTYETIGEIDYNECDIFRVERLWKDENGKRFIYGHHFLRPHETYHEPTRKFYPNEVVRVPMYEILPIELVIDRCWVLDRATFCKGRPIECTNEQHCFICELRVDKQARFFSKAKITYPTCTKSYAFHKFENKLRISKTYAPHVIDTALLKTRKAKNDASAVLCNNVNVKISTTKMEKSKQKCSISSVTTATVTKKDQKGLENGTKHCNKRQNKANLVEEITTDKITQSLGKATMESTKLEKIIQNLKKLKDESLMQNEQSTVDLTGRGTRNRKTSKVQN